MLYKTHNCQSTPHFFIIVTMTIPQRERCYCCNFILFHLDFDPNFTRENNKKLLGLGECN